MHRYRFESDEYAEGERDTRVCALAREGNLGGGHRETAERACGGAKETGFRRYDVAHRARRVHDAGDDQRHKAHLNDD
jgi:hypothetical protein